MPNITHLNRLIPGPTPEDYAKAEEEASRLAIWEAPNPNPEPSTLRASLIEALARQYAQLRAPKEEETSG